eukprot:4794400-Alexandrium_andersonii.AAC.1
MIISTTPYLGKLFAAPFFQSGPRPGERGGGGAEGQQPRKATPRHCRSTGEVLPRYWQRTGE